MDSVHDGYFQAYVSDNLRFAKTLTIKMGVLAAMLNKYIEDTFKLQVDQTDPSTWKYYMNLAGLYHPTDTVMTVRSIDTLEEIEFTKDNLKVHTGTAEAYAYGSRYYNALLVQYPSQELLINGILNPADINTAINASDGTILVYEKGLIEYNEFSLVEELQTWLYAQIYRWNVGQFAVSNNLYPAAFMVQLFLQIPLKLINLRLKRVKTLEAHSFHVRMYLASHSELDEYIPYLTMEQKLWLYRNITYIERHPGQNQTFQMLIDNLLTKRGIPISEYTIRLLSTFDEYYYPETQAKINPLNNPTNSAAVDYHSVGILYNKEATIAPGNQLYLDDNLENDLKRFSYADSAVIATKALLSSMVDYTNAAPVTFEEIALREWCHLSWLGLYAVMISFKDPKTSQSFSLLAKDAFLYMYYITLKADGYKVDIMPEFLNLDYRQHPMPTVQDLLAVAMNNTTPEIKTYANAIIDGQTNIRAMYSSSSFYEYIYSQYQECVWHWLMAGAINNMDDKASFRAMVQRLFVRQRVEFDTGYPSMDAWLFAKNLLPFDHTYAEAQQLVKNIYESATGIMVDNSKILRNIQKALLDLMTALSSYSVQFIREINETDIIIANQDPVNYGNQREHAAGHFINDVKVDIVDLSGSASEYHVTEVDEDTLFMGASHQATITAEIDTSHDTTLAAEINFKHQVLLPATWVSLEYPGQPTDEESTLGGYGLTALNNLPSGVKNSIKLPF